jgi:superfamily II DNA helicase RecQ
MGRARHLIVTVEQLFKSSAGHFARLGHLIRNNRIFQRQLIRINVDEAHSIHTAGIPLYGLPAFRPAWGKLDELKALLSNKIRWKAFSATRAARRARTYGLRLPYVGFGYRTVSPLA